MMFFVPEERSPISTVAPSSSRQQAPSSLATLPPPHHRLPLSSTTSVYLKVSATTAASAASYKHEPHSNELWSASTPPPTRSVLNFKPYEDHDYMDASTTTKNPSGTNTTAGRSPSVNSNNSDPPSAPADSPTTSMSTRKKPGRGPGKKDSKEKATVSVRWDDGDLTERLITAIEGNDRWTGVFASTNPGAGGEGGITLRPPPPVAKRDLQREIARHIFASDARFDLDDKKVLESLAVSVKNKLFKLTTLYNECKQELGHISEYKSERDIPQGSEQAVTWARVRVKFPQFYRIRDLMTRVSSLSHVSGAADQEDPISPGAAPAMPSSQSNTRSRTGTGASSNTSHSSNSATTITAAAATTTPQAPTTMNPPPHVPGSSSSALRGAVDLPKEMAPVPYGDPSASSASSSMMGSSYVGHHAARSESASATSSTYPQHGIGLGTSSSTTGYPYMPPPQSHATRRTNSSIPVSNMPYASGGSHSVQPSSSGPAYGTGMPSTSSSASPSMSSGYPQQPQAQPHPHSRYYYTDSSSLPAAPAGLYTSQPPLSSASPSGRATESPVASSTSPRVSSRRAHPYYVKPTLPFPSSPPSFLAGPRGGGSSRGVRSPDMQPMSTASPPLRDQNTPSPPLSQTIQAIVNSLTDKKDKDRAREHELEVMRMQREEAERVRWHQREMMRLRIQLIRAERSRGAAGSGTGDDSAMGEDGMDEGDGEGELEEDMIAESHGHQHQHQHHHHASSSHNGPPA